MKKCFKCRETKELDKFYKHKGMADGHLNKCIDCTKKDTSNNDRVYSNRVLDSYDRTQKGVIRVMYKTQVRNSKSRKMNLPDYTKEQFKEWLYSNNFEKLYNEWVNSGFDKNKKPSADRLDDFKPYTLNNIRLVTWEENRNHQIMDIINGTGTSGRRCKPVIQYDSNGNILAEYHSFSFARRVMGYSMEGSLKNGRPDRKNGFIWKYK